MQTSILQQNKKKQYNSPAHSSIFAYENKQDLRISKMSHRYFEKRPLTGSFIHIPIFSISSTYIKYGTDLQTSLKNIVLSYIYIFWTVKDKVNFWFYTSLHFPVCNFHHVTRYTQLHFLAIIFTLIIDTHRIQLTISANFLITLFRKTISDQIQTFDWLI